MLANQIFCITFKRRQGAAGRLYLKIVWDEPKRTSNLENRGLDFADLDIEFFAASTVIPAKAGRLKAIGEFGETILTVIFKPLGTEAISVISMRHASRKERKAHGQS